MPMWECIKQIEDKPALDIWRYPIPEGWLYLVGYDVLTFVPKSTVETTHKHTHIIETKPIIVPVYPHPPRPIRPSPPPREQRKIGLLPSPGDYNGPT